MSVLFLLLVVHSLFVCSSITVADGSSEPISQLYLQSQIKQVPHDNIVHFGIIIPVGGRSFDPDFLLLSRQSLKSVMAQTYSNWTIIFVGDHLPASSVEKVKAIIEKHNVPADKYILLNLGESQTKQFIYSRLNKTEINVRSRLAYVMVIQESLLILSIYLLYVV
jgi:hypothetical protein